MHSRIFIEDVSEIPLVNHRSVSKDFHRSQHSNNQECHQKSQIQTYEHTKSLLQAIWCYFVKLVTVNTSNRRFPLHSNGRALNKQEIANQQHPSNKGQDCRSSSCLAKKISRLNFWPNKGSGLSCQSTSFKSRDLCEFCSYGFPLGD